MQLRRTISFYAPMVIMSVAVVAVLFSSFWIFLHCHAGCRKQWPGCSFDSGAGASGADGGESAATRASPLETRDRQISSRSLPTMIRPLYARLTASIHIWSVRPASSAGTKCDSTNVFTPASSATRPTSSAEV